MSELVVGATLFTYWVDAYIPSWYVLLKVYTYIKCFRDVGWSAGCYVAIWSNSLTFCSVIVE